MYDQATEFHIPEDFSTEELAPNTDKITLGPLGRGFGYTLGNALRRVMLSSMPGFAVTEVQIEGAAHEYAVHEGLNEDVLDLLLNVKQVAVRLETGNRAELKLKATGSGEVRAGDIECDNDVTIANPELILAHLTGKRSLEMRMVVERGRGYLTAEQFHSIDKSDSRATDMIRLDASFSPVRRVAFRVEDTRKGDDTQLDQLIMELESNGTITAREAFSRAATILFQHLNPLIEGSAGDGRIRENAGQPAPDPYLSESVDKLGLPARITNALKREQVMLVGDLIQMTDKDLQTIPHVGKRTLEEINENLTRRGLALGTQVPNWPLKSITLTD